ncbi:MAG: acetolactate decarboxylase [Saprospiraceae bacterium]|jgi:acetolactate decarboxylase
MKVKFLLITLIIICLNALGEGQCLTGKVHITGEMRNVMWKGQLKGNIYLDTIANKSNVVGLGPLEYLGGEIIVMDGKSYKSVVISDSRMEVMETFDIKAPFFAHANISNWSEELLDVDFQTIQQLESFLDNKMSGSSQPFMFKLAGFVKEATIHVVNLPVGTKVSSPNDAHKGLVKYQMENQEAEIVGFFSKEHKGIFTHHDTYLHMHLMTKDKQMMGHLDELSIEMGKMRLFLCQN